jgi:transketolase
MTAAESGTFSETLDDLCLDTIRTLSASGHPGMPMGAAAMAYVLWTRHLRHDPADPAWINRDCAAFWWMASSYKSPFLMA